MAAAVAYPRLFPTYLCAALLAVALYTGCDSTTGIENLSPDDAELVIVAGNEQRGTVGEELPTPLRIRAAARDGTPIPGVPISWIVTSGGGQVLPTQHTVTGADGTTEVRWVLGTKVTESTITARVDEVDREVVFHATPLPGPIVRFDFSPDTVRLSALGDTATVRARAFDHLENEYTPTLEWSVSNPAVVTTDQAGQLLSRGNGTAWVVAKAPAFSDSVAVIVQQTVARVRALPKEVTFTSIGDTVRVASAALDRMGAVVLGAPIRWSVLDGSAVAVDSTGRITSRQVGTSRVLSSSGELADTVSARVQQVVASVQVTAPEPALPAGANVTLLAVASDARGVPIAQSQFTWSSSDSTVASVDGAGKVLARKPGQAIVKASSEGHDGTVTLTVTAGAPGRILIEGAQTRTGTVGATLAAPLAVRVEDALGFPVGGVAVQWSASAGSLSASSSATDAAGTAQTQWTLGSAVGNQTATASVSGVGVVSFSAAAAADAPHTLGIIRGSGQSAAPGAALNETLMVRVTDRFGNPIRDVWAKWATGSGSGTVDPDSSRTDDTGIAATRWTLGPTEGTHSATATAAGLGPVSFSATSRAPVLGVKIGSVAGTLHIEESVQLSVTVTGPGGATLSGRTVTWSSTNGGIASVSSGGLVTGVGSGNVYVLAVSEGVRDSVALQVSPIPVATVSVTNAPDSLSVGRNATLGAVLRDASGRTLSGRTVTWTSTNTSVATVSGSGVVTALAAGSTTVRATSESAVASVTIHVHHPRFGAPTCVGNEVRLQEPAFTAQMVDAVPFIIGPQLCSGSGANPWPWFDQTAISMGDHFGGRFPATPDGTDEYILENYYDQALVQYVNYFRTRDPRFLGYARKIADSWWLHGGILPVGGSYDDAFTPRNVSLGGLILRAMDGRPELWEGITDYVRFELEIWATRYIAEGVTELQNGIRDPGYMLTYAAWLAKAHPDAAVRAEMRTNALAAATEYFEPLQYPDGSWRWREDSPEGPGGFFTQPFMMGLLLEGMISVHQLTGDATVRASILSAVDFLYTSGYRTDSFDLDGDGTLDGRWRGMWYFTHGNECAPPVAGTKCGEATIVRDGDANVIREVRQLNPLTIHAFGYAYKLTGDAKYRTWGDEIFSATFGAGVGPGADEWHSLADWNERGREYNQSFRSTGRYLAWRAGL